MGAGAVLGNLSCVGSEGAQALCVVELVEALGFQGQIAISLRSAAQHPQGEPKARGIWALTLKTPACEFFLIHGVRAVQSSGAALSPRRATYLFLLRQNKVSQKKATLVSASLRFASGTFRCSAQPGSRSNSLRSDNRGPCSVWASAPQRIHKGFAGRVRDRIQVKSHS